MFEINIGCITPVWMDYMKYEEVIKELESLSNPEDVEGMSRFGINPEKTYAVRIPQLRQIAKKIGKNHEMAHKLWYAGYRETRIIASIIEDPKLLTDAQMDEWVLNFDTWDICDQCCMNLFRKTPLAYKKIYQWSQRNEELVKRASFTLIATLAVHDKKASDDTFEKFLPLIIRESCDGRNYVKKAVNWALGQIGKRNNQLNKKAIETAVKIQKIDNKAAKWIARDALRELTSEKIQERIKG